MPPLLKMLLLLVLYTLTTNVISEPALSGNETDNNALLAIKSKISQDLHGVLNSWNESIHFCQWEGVTCGHRHKRVTKLELYSHNLGGSLSPFIGNLTFLRILRLYNNSFTGIIPAEVGRLFRLEKLHVGNNSFQGKIPTNISGCMRLLFLQMNNNKLMGKLSSGLSFLNKLKILSLSGNNLIGDLFPLGNLTSLQIISLSSERSQGMIGFSGSIPDFIGNFKDLTALGLGGNSFTGQIPPSLYNLSNLQVLSLSNNLLEEVLPPDMGFYFPQLQLLQIFNNQFSGSIPFSFSNLSNLISLDIGNNNFTGKFSFDGRKIPNLINLNLNTAIMGLGEVDELDFLNTLQNCSNLQNLGLDENNFGGNLPHSIANLSIHITNIDLGSNLISGNIPLGLGNLLSLRYLVLDHNQLTGNIPTDIGRLSMLEDLFLHNNLLSGSIPSSLGNISKLSILDVRVNKIQGIVPATLGNCNDLIGLDLSYNNLVGNVPPQLFQASAMVNIYLEHNKLQGSLPSEIGKLQNLYNVDMSNNKFSGSIPSSFGQCLDLTFLQLQGNSFTGFIPPTFSLLKGLQAVDLSSNRLSGQVPKYFCNFTSLMYLNLSFNNLEADVPVRGVFANVSAVFLIGNNKLCGGIPQLKLPACPMDESKVKGKSHAFVIAMSISCFIVGLIIVSFTHLYCTRRKRKDASSETLNKEKFIKVSYDMLLKATNGFSPANLLGSGSFSSVYRGTILIDGVLQDVAIKVINNQHRGASKSFLAECEALRIVRHRNLVRVITACSSIDFQGNIFKALVYEFMSKGNLEQWLHPNQPDDDQFKSLNLQQRLNIAIDIANAVDYIHNDNETSIIHCDLKPTNILLDDDLTAHVGDFGLVKLLQENSEQAYNNSSIGVRGTVGYAAPEYGYGTSVSTAGDMYSYGIIILEIMTAKKPTDSMFEGDMSLHKFAEFALPDHLLEIIDPILLIEDNDEEGNMNLNNARMVPNCVFRCITTMISIGVKCSSELPADRMSIKDVIHQLQTQRGQLNMCQRYHRCSPGPEVWREGQWPRAPA